MVPLSLLLLIFLSSCGLITVEVKDKQKTMPQPEPTKTSKKQEDWRELEGVVLPGLQRKEHTQRHKALPSEGLRVAMPLRGQPIKSERGYYIRSSCGEFFRSVSEGKVLYAGNDLKSYDWVVMVEGDNFVYVYAKASSSLVKKGERVSKGQPLGKVGQSQEGCGILFEVRDAEGRPINFELLR